MSEFKDDKEVLVVCDCGRKLTVKTTNTVEIIRPNMEVKDEKSNNNDRPLP